MNGSVFKIQDLEKVTAATVKWQKTYPNSNQIYRDKEGKAEWLSKKLSEGKIREFIDYLRASKFTAYASGGAALHKSHKHRVNLEVQDGRAFELIEADACSRMIVVGSGEFVRSHGDCFDFGIDNQ